MEEEVAPLAEVFFMAAEEVVFQVVMAEVDIALNVAEVPQDLSAEDWSKELVASVSTMIAFFDSSLGSSLLALVLLEAMEKSCSVRQLPVLYFFYWFWFRFWPLQNLNPVLRIDSLGLHLAFLLLFLYLFFFKVLFGLVLGFADLSLLLLHLHFLLEFGGLLSELSLRESFLCRLEFFVGKREVWVVLKTVGRATACT